VSGIRLENSILYAPPISWVTLRIRRFLRG
jgi:hypothetical protein